MSDRITEEREREFSERFNCGVKPVGDPEEAAVHDFYRTIDRGLRAMPVDRINPATLAQQLARQTEPRLSWLRQGLISWEAVPVPVFAAVSILLFGLVYLGFHSLLRAPNTHPAHSFALVDASTDQRVATPLFWEQRLQSGALVSVPLGARARLELSDGSTIHCSPGTMIALSFETGRQIELRAGSISVKAESNPNDPMTVDTEAGIVTVVGTEFSVSLAR